MFEVGWILKIREIPTSLFLSATKIFMTCYNLQNEHSAGPQKNLTIFSETTSSKKVRNAILVSQIKNYYTSKLFYQIMFFLPKKNMILLTLKVPSLSRHPLKSTFPEKTWFKMIEKAEKLGFYIDVRELKNHVLFSLKSTPT